MAKHRPLGLLRPPSDDSRKVKEAEAIYNSLIRHHSLSTPYHRALAGQITTALMRGDLDRATRAIALLPPVPHAIVSEPTVSPSAARKKITDLIRNAVAAHQAEEGRGESTEVASLRAQVESLQDECRHLRGTKPRRLPKPTDKPVAKSAADPKADARPASPPTPPPDPTKPGQWDASPSGQAYHAWNAAGGAVSSGTYGPVPGSDGLSAQAWINRLNSREW
jgi:hypothetical protein